MAWISSVTRTTRTHCYVERTAASGTVHVSVYFYPWNVEFWESAQSDGYDVLFATNDGATLIPTVQRASWDYTNRVAEFRLSSVGLQGDASFRWVHSLFCYTGATTPVVVDPSSGTPTTTLSAYAAAAAPPRALQIPLPPPGSAVPTQRIQIQVGSEQREVWIDLRALLSGAQRPVGGSSRWSEIAWIQWYTEQNGAGTDNLWRASSSWIVGGFARGVLAGATAGEFVAWLAVAIVSPAEKSDASTNAKTVVAIPIRVTVADVQED